VIVTVPVRNEAPRIGRTLNEVRRALDTAGFDYVLSVAEDGSTDGTKETLQGIQASNPPLLVQRHDQPLGRGKALRLLWPTVPGDVYCFVDADLACGTAPLVEAIALVQSGADIAVGSRYVRGATVSRPPLRALVSRFYNDLVRIVFREQIHDHQCGVKAFSSRAIKTLLPLTSEDSWFWDTEILVRAIQQGFKVTEFPVHWTELKAPRTEFSRLLSDMWLHGTGVLRLSSTMGPPREVASGLGVPSPKSAEAMREG
jgi:glycosyltransferase AglD